jgi:hypothetical protein
MPNGLPPLSKDELELVRLWIYSGAPETGTVAGTPALLGACLPPPTPITIGRSPPPRGDGISSDAALEARRSEHEILATYYDITDQVPKEFQDRRDLFRFSGQELRQIQSHHLILNPPRGSDVRSRLRGLDLQRRRPGGAAVRAD